MPRVPVSQGNSVTTRALPVAAVRPVTLDDSVGQGLQRLGGALGEAAQAQDEIDYQIDDTTSRRLTLEYQTEASKILSEYQSLEGLDAVAAERETKARLDRLREEVVGRTSSPRMRAMAEARVAGYHAADGIKIGEFSSKALKLETDRTLVAQSARAVEEAAENFGDPAISDQHVETVGALAWQHGDNKGWSEEATAIYAEEQVSVARLAVAQRMLVEDDIDGALVYVERHGGVGGTLMFKDEQTIRRALKEPLEFRQSEADAQLVLGGIPDLDAMPSTDDGEQPALTIQLAAIESNESNGRQFDGSGKPLRSHKGATGVMQVMPSTGPEAARLAGLPWDRERFENDEHYNRALGQAYYRDMLRRFDGNPLMAAAAYNAGPGRVENIIRKHGDDWVAHLPAETRDYVKKFEKKTNASDLRGAASGKIDIENAYQRLDEIARQQDWTPERHERARQRLDAHIQRDDTQRSRREAEAWDAALDQVDTLGLEFTDVSQIKGFSALPADRRLQLRGMAETNRSGGVDANGDVAVSLNVMAIEQPEKFAYEIDLREYKDKVTPAEFEALRLKQSKIATDPEKEVSIRSGISSSIGYYATKEMNLTGEKNRNDRLRVMDAMESYLKTAYPDIAAGKRAPTDKEYREAFDHATEKVVVRTNIWGKGVEESRFKHEMFDVPRPDRVRIATAFHRVHGRPPKASEVIEIYQSEQEQ